MSTRALYTFTDNDNSWNVYKHCDGYPSGAADTLNTAAKWFAWQLPRFEADEFAAAFCAAGKAYRMVNLAEGKTSLKAFQKDDAEYGKNQHGGGIRFMPQGNPHDVAETYCGDIEYRYEISTVKGKLHIDAYSVSAWETYSEKKLFSGTLPAFTAWTKKDRKLIRCGK